MRLLICSFLSFLQTCQVTFIILVFYQTLIFNIFMRSWSRYSLDPRNTTPVLACWPNSRWSLAWFYRFLRFRDHLAQLFVLRAVIFRLISVGFLQNLGILSLTDFLLLTIWRLLFFTDYNLFWSSSPFSNRSGDRLSFSISS